MAEKVAHRRSLRDRHRVVDVGVVEPDRALLDGHEDRHGGQHLGHRREAERSIGVARRDHGTVGGAHRGGGVIDRPAVDLVERTLHSADRTGL